jgi:REP element-mobilizing transposase RayT
MSENKRTSPDEVYFITLTIVGWINLFTRSCYKNILIKNLEYFRREKKLEIYAYVIMSNHLHMLCLRRETDLNELLGRFKGYTSKQFLKEIEQNSRESQRS